jgi:hypothetical protein
MARPTASFSCNGTTFTVDAKYRLIKPIGSGAYGVVVAAEDTSSGARVAIKKVPAAFTDLTDAKRVLRELKLMRHLGAHDNLVQLVDLIEPPSLAGFADVYIVSNLFETDLHRVLCSKQVLSSQHVQYFIYQLLRGLKVLHDARVIHRDLKPSNLLVNSNCDLAICDYGLARGMPPENDPRVAGSSSSGGGSGGGASGSPSPPPVALTEYVVSTLVGWCARSTRAARRPLAPRHAPLSHPERRVVRWAGKASRWSAASIVSASHRSLPPLPRAPHACRSRAGTARPRSCWGAAPTRPPWTCGAWAASSRSCCDASRCLRAWTTWTSAWVRAGACRGPAAEAAGLGSAPRSHYGARTPSCRTLLDRLSPRPLQVAPHRRDAGRPHPI